MRVLDGASGVGALIGHLQAAGYDVHGPVVHDGAIEYDQIDGVDDLPAGWSDVQAPGSYRLERRDDEALFQYASATQSWKRLLHPPVQTILRVERTEDGVRFVEPQVDERRYALLGVRACDLHAIRSLESALSEDTELKKRRQSAFIIAVNCTRSSGTCFCTAMGTGPRAEGDFDIALTELLPNGQGLRYTAEAGSDRGAAVLDELESTEADAETKKQAERAIRQGAEQQRGRTLDTSAVAETLQASENRVHWEQVAKRCTACGACTMACPTCFCSTVVDSNDVTGTTAERTKLWDSCFSREFSYIHGGSVRRSGAARYRQWITHKLAYWRDQFDTAGCVGCGRCVTWCPVGIDIVEEARAVKPATVHAGGSHGNA